MKVPYCTYLSFELTEICSGRQWVQFGAGINSSSLAPHRTAVIHGLKAAQHDAEWNRGHMSALPSRLSHWVI
jgi:hypothetical protein